MSGAQDNIFRSSSLINCGGRILDLSTPCVMGIINVTPDSFHAEARVDSERSLLALAEKHLIEGATFLDIGAVSSRPGARDIPSSEEWRRLKPALTSIVKHYPNILISVDTFRAEVAVEAVEHGAHMINDISGGELDEKMFGTVAKLQVPYLMMHMKGTPATMQENPVYEDIKKEVFEYFMLRVHKLRSMGHHDIIIDPGFGFSKNISHNYQLLKGLDELHQLQCPLLAGVSRKSMVNRIIRSKPETALNGTTALHMLTLSKGVSILRVHDVKEAKEAIAIYQAYLDPDML